MRRKARWRTGASLVVIGACAASAACGRSDAAAPASTAPGPATSGEAHPFAADAPLGFEQVTLGRGVWTQSWGDDSGGNDAPFTVLSDGARSVEISANGYAGFEGGGDLARVAYRFGGDAWEDVSVDGDAGLWSPQTADDPAQLLVERGDDLALRLVGTGVSEDELVELAAATEPSEDHGTAPVVEEPPAPWHVVGSVDADVLGAATSSLHRQYLSPPGPESGYGIGWLAGDAPLMAVTLDGDALDVEALIPRREWNGAPISTGRVVTVAGRPGVLLDLCYCAPLYEQESHSRSVLTHDDSGAALVVTTYGDSGVTEDQLIAVAASVRPVEPDTWDAAVEQSRMLAANGPGLHPDEGESEIGRGIHDDLEWLLQTDSVVDILGAPRSGVDACLKLGDYTAACALPRGGAGGDALLVAMESEVEPRVGAFVIVVTRNTDGDAVRISTETETGTGTLFPVPGTDERAAVVFVDDPGAAVCEDLDPPPPPSMARMRIDLLTAGGVPVGCVSTV